MPQQSFAQQFNDAVFSHAGKTFKRSPLLFAKRGVTFNRFDELFDAFVLRGNSAKNQWLPSVTAFGHFQQGNQFAFCALDAIALDAPYR